MNLEYEILSKSFVSFYSEKCPSEHTAMCPSKHEICVVQNIKLKLRIKASPPKLAPKPTRTQRANIMGLKAPNMRVMSNVCQIISVMKT